MITLHQFSIQVATMRTAQALYFQQIGIAKKSKLPRDFAEAANTLKISKQLEKDVDLSIAQMHSEAAQRPTSEPPVPKSIIQP